MNHGFVTTKNKAIDLDLVDKTIREIAEGPCKGILEVERDGDTWWLGHNDFAGVVVWPQSTRRLAFRRGALGDFTGWLQNLLQCEIGKAVKGRLSDEGVSEIWAPTKEETPTWKSYFDAMFGHCPKAVADDLWQRTVDGLPDDLRKLATT